MVYESNYRPAYSDELYHYGVKGMRWGHRKASTLGTSDLYNRYQSAKSAKKAANKAYSKAFNKANNRAISAWSPIKKHRQANDERWADAVTKAKRANAADSAYKKVKNERKSAIKSTYQKLNKQASFKDKLIYNNATRKKAAKYVVDNGMSMADATKKANAVARRNTAAILGAYGAVAVGAAIYTKMKG